MNPDQSLFTIMLIIVATGMMALGAVMTLFVFLYQRRTLQEELRRQQMEAEFQRKRIQAALDSQEDERRRVAARLQNSVGAMLLNIRAKLTTLASNEKDMEESLQPTGLMLDETIDSVRAISWNLMPPALERSGLMEAVGETCTWIRRASNIEVIFEGSGTPVRPGKAIETTLFRVVQELLNNALKHARATEIRVQISFKDHLHIVVADNGTGFDFDRLKGAQDRTGLGLVTIENRIRFIGADVTFGRNGSGGSKISIRLALDKESSKVKSA